MSVYLGNISPADVKSHYVRCLLRSQYLFEDSILGWGDHDLGKSRNVVVQQFLDTSAPGDKLWFVDSDMVWRHQDLAQFLTRHHGLIGVVGGTYKRPQWELRDGTWTKAQTEYDARDASGAEFPHGTQGVRPCSYVGAGALLVAREVYETVGRDWYTLRGRGVAEDLSFCLRAHDAGFPVYADFGFSLGHVKEEVIY